MTSGEPTSAARVGPASAGAGSPAPPPLPGRVLYVQHAGCLGGSATSLRLLVGGMRSCGIDCTVALARPTRELEDFYATAGIPTVAAPDICCWDHSTVAPRFLTNPRHLLDLASVRARWNASRAATLRLVDRIRPDLVHLNSMPLSSSASALTEAGFPFVWHVREPPPDQGVRTRIIRDIMRSAPQCVFITRYDKREWIGDAPARIIYNCVPDEWFGAPAACGDGGPAAADGVVRFAYMGSYSGPKGATVLLDALRSLRRSATGWECVMPACLPDAKYASRERPAKRLARALGYSNVGERLLPQFRELAPQVRLMPFVFDVRALLETVDFVVFPATLPHFPRPVIEAAALGKPAVGTDVGGVDECVVHGETGLLCAPGDAVALAGALAGMVSDGAFRRAAGERARERAVRLHSLTAQREAILATYRDVLAGRSDARSRMGHVTG
jgi:glycosyltransferase involved in cell wall biosynthesis